MQSTTYLSPSIFYSIFIYKVFIPIAKINDTKILDCKTVIHTHTPTHTVYIVKWFKIYIKK